MGLGICFTRIKVFKYRGIFKRTLLLHEKICYNYDIIHVHVPNIAAFNLYLAKI